MEGISPASGPAAGGTVVTILGSNFGLHPTVKFGEQVAVIRERSHTRLVVVSPSAVMSPSAGDPSFDVWIEVIVAGSRTPSKFPPGSGGKGGSLKGRAGIDWSAPEERRSFLNGVVQEARLLLEETVGDGDVSTEVSEAAELLRRILVQDLECVAEDRGGPEDGDKEQSVLSLDAEVQIRQGVVKDRVVSAGRLSPLEVRRLRAVLKPSRG